MVSFPHQPGCPCRQPTSPDAEKTASGQDLLDGPQLCVHSLTLSPSPCTPRGASRRQRVAKDRRVSRGYPSRTTPHMARGMVTRRSSSCCSQIDCLFPVVRLTAQQFRGILSSSPTYDACPRQQGYNSSRFHRYLLSPVAIDTSSAEYASVSPPLLYASVSPPLLYPVQPHVHRLGSLTSNGMSPSTSNALFRQMALLDRCPGRAPTS